MSQINHTRWVFAYGSLMWRPGFEYAEKHAAILNEYARSLCVYSHVHRGTPQLPGLVFGLDCIAQDDSCKGIAYRVEDQLWQQTVAYLRAREQVTAVYVEEIVPIQLNSQNSQNSQNVSALTYCVDPTHKQYAGQLSLDEQLKFVRQGHGQSGICRDYVLSTADHLNELNVEDKSLQALTKQLLRPDQLSSD